jgi:hypothetical protein
VIDRAGDGIYGQMARQLAQARALDSSLRRAIGGFKGAGAARMDRCPWMAS